MTTTLEFSHVYRGLKDFQLDTVAHVVDRLYGDDAVRRFLVADEVGLGKTLVARGVIARTIEHHVEVGTGRIDVVYICSNADIAKQNVGRLNVLERNDFDLATRITLLPWILENLQGNRINFVSFTPGTSFNLRSSEGIVKERVLLYHMLRDIWGPGVVRAYQVDQRVFAGGASFENFYPRIQRFADSGRYDEGLGEKFGVELETADRQRPRGTPSLQDRFLALRERFVPIRRNSSTTVSKDLRAERAEFIGELREILARTCVEALEPDLVILDEFQRFKHLFDDTDPAGDLARHLFAYEGVKVLLLSATPYKMYTLSDETQDDHYEDFLDTLRFLMGDEAVSRFARHLRDYRRGLFTLADSNGKAVRDAKYHIERSLGRVMSRTERLAVTEDRSGMLTTATPRNLRLHADDVRQYIALSRLGEDLEVGGMLEYWKSSAYPFSFMEGYQLDRKIEQLDGDGDLDRVRHQVGVPGLALSLAELEAYAQVDPGNARLRSLAADVVDSGAWKLLWVPPALPYYTLDGPFAQPGVTGLTKRLVFSAWRVVPKVIASLVSYEVERRMVQSFDPDAANTTEARNRFSGLLRFQLAQGRLTGMPVFGLLYPSPALADLGDPRELGGESGGHTRPLSLDDLLHEVRARLGAALRSRLAEAPDGGAEDDRWYWAVPLLLDQERDAAGTLEWLGRRNVAHRFVHIDPEERADDTGESGWSEHVEAALELVQGRADPLGRPPADLLDVLAEMALAGPGVSALRALDRVNGRGFDDVATRDHAGYVAWGIRHLFNLMDVTYLLRSESSGKHQEDAYWRLVLRYCLDGCLQSVLDEYVHVVHEWRGTTGAEGTELLAPITETIREALELRRVNYKVRHLETDTNGGVSLSSSRMRGLYALRFGDERSSDDEKSVQRSSSVRAAFNSPFRPFVLATTSIGQEGLDFHMYCHAVVHWNLPSNPVDLEQREGRVHRYKGHAVRKNLAIDQRAAAFGDESDPWVGLFRAGERSRQDGDNELVPFWVYAPEGGAQIERYVPALPLSRASRKLKQLQKSLAAYRLVFGQPRQEDLVAYLQQRMDPEELRDLLDDLRIDITPPTLSRAARESLRQQRPVHIEPPPSSRRSGSSAGAAELTPREQRFEAFWDGVLDELNDQFPGWTSQKPKPTSWIDLGAGTSHVHYALAFAGERRMRVELYVDPGEELHDFVWQFLESERQAIESRFGESLTYEPLPDSRASRIAHYYPDEAAITREEDWDTYQSWLVTEIGRFRDAIQPAVDALSDAMDGSVEDGSAVQDFWRVLIAEGQRQMGSEHPATSKPRTSGHTWSSIGGIAGVGYQYWVNKSSMWICLRFDTENPALNEWYLRQLGGQRDLIEEEFGDRLQFKPLEDSRASMLRYDLPDGGLRDSDRWEEIARRSVDAMERLYRATRDRVLALDPPAEPSGQGRETA